MRNFTLPALTRGLNLVSPVSKLRAGQLSRAENVVFTRTSAKRRPGRLAAYKRAAAASASTSMLHRFYKLATTGTVSKFFLKSFGSLLYKAGADWSDDTRTLLSAWTAIDLPDNTADNTLYANYSAASTVVLSGGAIRRAYSSKSWLYMPVEYDSSDNASIIKNVPLRSDGTNCYLHGLVPPAALVIADTSGGSALTALTASQYRWVNEDTTADASGFPALLRHPAEIGRDSDGVIYVLYYDGGSTDLRCAVRSTAGVWSLEVVDAAGVLTTAGLRILDLVVDSGDNVHAVYAENDATADLKYAYRAHSTGAWVTESVEAAGANAGATDCSIDVDSSDRPNVAYRWTAGGVTVLKHAAKAAGTWTVTVTDNATAADVGAYCSIALDATNAIHIAYQDTTNADQRYAAGAAGTTKESVFATGTSGLYGRIAILSTNVPVIAFQADTGGTNAVRYADRTGGTWATEVAVSGTTVPGTVGFALDSSNNPYIIYQTASAATLSKRVSAVWAAATIDTASSSGGFSSALVDENGAVHTAYSVSSNKIHYGYSEADLYHYRLTAEYDNGVLGESGPSAALAVYMGDEISSTNTNTLDLDDAAARYDMTDDVTRIYVYRTIRAAGSGGTYYRVGSVACTSGAPTADFVDNVSDTDLVGNVVLDEDKHLPPKYKVGVVWKDRCVIANLKTRDTDLTDGTYLDDESGGIHKNRIRFSDAFHPDIFRQNFFQDILPDGDSGSIQQVVVNPRNDSLYVLMENDVVALTDLIGDTVSSLSFRPRNIANSHGTPSPGSVVEYEGLIFYWTKWGIEVISGGEARNITSDTIGVLWNLQDATHPRYEDRIMPAQFPLVRGTVWVDSGSERILWTYAAAGNSTCNRILCLDYARWRDSGFQDDGVFSIWTNWNIACFARWDGEGDRGELFGGESVAATAPGVYRLCIADVDEQMNSAGTLTTSAVAAAVLKHGLTDAGTEERLKRFGTVRIDGRIKTLANTGACSVVVAADVNDGDLSVTLDTVTWTQGGVKRVSKNFPHTAIGMYGGIQITATDGTPGAAGGSPPFELHAISYTVQDVVARTVRG